MGSAATLTGLARVVQQAEQLKLDGNVCFSKKRFGAAIDAYTGAITLCPNEPIYWTNRARCHVKRNDWAKVEADCRKAIQLDKNSVKGHCMLGLALLQRKEYAEAIKELERELLAQGATNHVVEDFTEIILIGKERKDKQKALDLGVGANSNGCMVEDIWQELAQAKYLEWEESSSKRSWELQSLKEACEAALEEKLALGISTTEDFFDEAVSAHKRQMEALNQVFRKVAEADMPTEVPDYLCCKITLDIIRDPVITPSGLTYEKTVILEHLEKGGNFDPITRKPLNPSQLVPNLAIKEAVRAFLAKHAWAYKTC